MKQKFLYVLLILSAGYAVSGVTAGVSAHMNNQDESDILTVAKIEDDRKEVRLVNVPTEKDEANISYNKDDSEKEEAIIDSTGTNEVVSVFEAETETASNPLTEKVTEAGSVTLVPFFSQFKDITPVEWRKVGCGVASLAMLIDFYEPGVVSVDKLLQDGIDSGAYLSSAGWTHAGLINLSKKFGLEGESYSLSDSSMDSAFSTLVSVLKKGPVMASVHYTFDSNNPIPHLVVINDVRNGLVHYNDPAEAVGGGTLPISQFRNAWKKRYIEIRPVI